MFTPTKEKNVKNEVKYYKTQIWLNYSYGKFWAKVTTVLNKFSYDTIF